MHNPRASVIIPVYNRQDMILRCVRSVLAQTVRDVEVIVVDDASTDGTARALATVEGVSLIRHDKRRGPAAARNAGAAQSHGSVLVFLDSDCWAESTDWLEQHLIAHESGQDAVFGGPVTGRYRTYGGGAFSYLNWFALQGGTKDKPSGGYVPAANLSVSRKVFDSVGPFDEALPVLEDVEWCYRAQSLGIPIRLTRGATVYHENREGLAVLWRHHKQYGLWSIPVRRRHPESPRAWLFPKGLASSILMAGPLAMLMTLYIVGTVLPRSPRVLWYIPGIVWGHLAYSWGVIQFFLTERKGEAQVPGC